MWDVRCGIADLKNQNYLRHLRRMPRPMDGDECERGGARRGSNPLLGTVSRSGSVKKI